MTDSVSAIPSGPAALFLGHPGHELRVYGWTRLVRPRVYILTDGSGAEGVSRLDRTAALLGSLGSSRGSIFGRFADIAFYRAVLDGRAALFTGLVDEIAGQWIDDGIELVACDANEGYCPTHDLCCEMAAAAAALVERRTGRRIRRYTFRLTEFAPREEELRDSGALCLRLDDGVLDEKIAAARSYIELRNEVDHALALKGPEYFRDEWLHPAGGWDHREHGYKPFYEELGERRVAQGVFDRVLRHRDHVAPIFEALRAHAGVALPEPHAIA